MQNGLSLQRCTPKDAALLRTLRLAMLAESPSNYRADGEAVAREPFAYWEDLALSGSQGGERVIYFAFFDDEPVAMIGARAVRGVSYAGALWVDPLYRRRRIANALFDAVETWSLSHKRTVVELSVARLNLVARRIYEERGYSYAGGVVEGSDTTSELVMRKVLI